MKPWTLFVVLGLLVPGESAADPFSIQVLTTRYTTTVQVDATSSDLPQIQTTRHATSTTPTTDVFALMGFDWATASADLLTVTTRTEAGMDPMHRYGGKSMATAESALTFAPMADGVADLAISLIGFSQVWWSDGRLQLHDVTTNEVLWNYGWTCCFFQHATMPWSAPPEYNGQAAFTIAQPLLAAHEYVLTMMISTNAHNDREGLTMAVSGLTPVPEPSTILLVGTGLIAAGVRRRRRSFRS